MEDSEGWIKHDGGPCPVAGDVILDDVWQRGQGVSWIGCGGHPIPAKDVLWGLVDKYRLAEPQAHMMSAPEAWSATSEKWSAAWAAAFAAIPEEAETPYGAARRQIADLEAERDQLKESLREMTFFKNIWLQVAKDYARAIEGYRDAARGNRDSVGVHGDNGVICGRTVGASLLVTASPTHMLGQGNDEVGEPVTPKPLLSWGNPV
jgi:hypothetical protein